MNIKSKEKIGYAFMAITIVLLSIHIYQLGANKESRLIGVAGYIALIVSSVYNLWLSKEKKKIEDL